MARCQSKNPSECKIHGTGGKIARLTEKANVALLHGDLSTYIKSQDKITSIWENNVEEKQSFFKSLLGKGNPTEPAPVESETVEHSHHSEPEPAREAQPGVEMVPCGKCSVCDPPPSDMTHFHSYHLNSQCLSPVPAQ